MYFVEKYHLSLFDEKERKHNIQEITQMKHKNASFRLWFSQSKNYS